MFAALRKVIEVIDHSLKLAVEQMLPDGTASTAETLSDHTMASRQPSIYALMIINKAGGLIYQKNYAG